MNINLKEEKELQLNTGAEINQSPKHAGIIENSGVVIVNGPQTFEEDKIVDGEFTYAFIENETELDNLESIFDEVPRNKYALPLREMIEKVQSEPKREMLYSGIQKNSIGFVFGPSKSAKTIFCENLGLSIAAGKGDYLGLPINSENRKVLFASLEEFYSGRTDRNAKQIQRLIKEVGNDSWLDNYRSK
jgi:hypothetical protein